MFSFYLGRYVNPTVGSTKFTKHETQHNITYAVLEGKKNTITLDLKKKNTA